MDILRRFAENYPVRQEPQKPGWFRDLWWQAYVATMPIHHWDISSRGAEMLTYLRRLQWMSAQDTEKLQLARLRQLLEHAYRHIPYYQNIMQDRMLRPIDFNSLDDLRRLPMLEKRVAKNAIENGLLGHYPGMHRPIPSTTSGSTGEPSVFYVDAFQLEMRWATTWRNLEWTGYRFGDRHVRLWHQTIGMSPSQIVREWLQSALCRRTFVPQYRLNDRAIGKFVRRIENARPVLIDGYAEALNLIASYIRSCEIAGTGALSHRPHGIITSAQMMPEHSRRLIESVFGCQVFDKYGAREFSGIAHECDHRGMHVNAESYIVEILHEGRPVLPGESGEVLVTDLNNYTAPLIRYRIGDIATAVDSNMCECGRGLPLIGSIEGRTQAIIIGADGQYLPGSFFARMFADRGDVRQYQVEQTHLGHLVMRIVKGTGYGDATRRWIEKHLRTCLGDMQFEFEYVASIPLGRTGKHHHSISHIKVGFNSVVGQ